MRAVAEETRLNPMARQQQLARLVDDIQRYRPQVLLTRLASSVLLPRSVAYEVELNYFLCVKNIYFLIISSTRNMRTYNAL